MKSILKLKRILKLPNIVKVRVKPELSPPQKAKDFFDFKWNDKKADFNIRAKHDSKLGNILGEKSSSSHIGVTVKDKNKLLPKFSEYAFENLFKNTNWLGKHAKGTIQLKHIRTSDLKNTSIEDILPMMKKQRKEYEKDAFSFLKKKKYLKKKNSKSMVNMKKGKSHIVFRKVGRRIIPIRKKK